MLLLPGSPDSQEMYVFNLTSLAESENVLSAWVYYYVGRLPRAERNRSQSGSCSGRRKPDFRMHLSVWTFPSGGTWTRTPGCFLVNVSTAYRNVLFWRRKDITWLLREAKWNHELVIAVKTDPTGGRPWKRTPFRYEHYLLIYANDSAILEPGGIVSGSRGRRRPPARLSPWPEDHRASGLGKRPQWPKRSANVLLPLWNELPGA